MAQRPVQVSRCRSETGAPGREAWPASSVRFRAPARCRSETGAPSREIGVAQRRRCRFRAPARCRSETGAPSREIGVASVVGAGFALPRDAGQRPALQRPRDSSPSAIRALAAPRAAVPTGGRRSLACASLRLVAWAPRRAPSRNCTFMTGGVNGPARSWGFSRWGPGDRRSWACAPPCVGGGYPSAKKTDGSELCSLPA